MVSVLSGHKGVAFKPSGLLDLLSDALLTVLCFLGALTDSSAFLPLLKNI